MAHEAQGRACMGTVASRLDRLAFGHMGDVGPVNEGISELRIHHGPGCRIYILQRGNTVVVLLRGGTRVPGARIS
jgi:putative addiction module killer protein